LWIYELRNTASGRGIKNHNKHPKLQGENGHFNASLSSGRGLG
jgi:hypothetical protein